MDGRPENVSKNERSRTNDIHPRMRFRRNNDESPSRTIQLVVKTYEQRLSSTALLIIAEADHFLCRNFDIEDNYLKKLPKISMLRS